jgi:(S)-2-hydroxyglutarate dehydrogenase
MTTVAVIGGGIVGLATARAVRERWPHVDVVVLEKEHALASHQTGRNSGVIHAGVYYKPESLKAQLCFSGRDDLMAFCRERGVPFEITGKLIAATSEAEERQLDELQRRSEANGLVVSRLDAAGVREIEPYCVAQSGLLVRSTGVVNFGKVADALGVELAERGVDIRLGARLVGGGASGARVRLELEAGGSLDADVVVNCAGLQSDRLAIMLGGPDVTGGLRIVPFRGEYFDVAPSKHHTVRALIYPVPDPRFPFLGVHLTKGIDKHVHVGPNAVLALQREGYSWRHVDRHDTVETLRFKGFQRLAKRYWRYGMSEVARSLSRRRLADSVARLVPAVEASDLSPAQSGVRAQAVRADGQLVDDFAFARSERALHVLNAPSPAATASLAIGTYIAGELATSFGDAL